ncbi:uncharacterized protein BJ212DRAFT_1284830 [Suillus subaureus]|uniref:MI domain-containing protein n=1 Tax=Suillus subaureus TaxID=48587 RepID=A0A9P7DVR8_9AGAM|nr:uncharacterized protein BJ212DRAFT_1284830 [Suillus subaureus]KAG1804040.1 hypothetical protein BJ212DRAFT_1284830 [Suillus subaureus]
MSPSGIFGAGKKDGRRETFSRTNSNSNMFCMLSQNLKLTTEAFTKPSHSSSRKSSTDPGHDGVPEPTVQHRKLQLFPQTVYPADESIITPLEEERESVPIAISTPSISEADVKMIDEDVKEFFAIRNLQEAEVYFTNLPDEHRFRLVNKLVGSALESKEADARLVGDFFAQAMSSGQCTLEVFEKGFMPMAEFLDDIAIDAPKAFGYMAIMLRGAGFENEPERLQRIASKLGVSDKLVSLVA